MARRFVSAAEHHTLQQAGPVEWKKKTAGRWRWGGSVSTTCCNRQNSARHIAAQSGRAKMFQDRLSPFSACLRGTHSIMRRIWADTSHSRSIAGVEEEEEREEEGGMNNSTSQCCSALTSCVLWGGEASRQQQQAAPPHMTARGYSIQGTSIFPRTGHHFREQQ